MVASCSTSNAFHCNVFPWFVFACTHWELEQHWRLFFSVRCFPLALLFVLDDHIRSRPTGIKFIVQVISKTIIMCWNSIGTVCTACVDQCFSASPRHRASSRTWRRTLRSSSWSPAPWCAATGWPSPPRGTTACPAAPWWTDATPTRRSVCSAHPHADAHAHVCEELRQDADTLPIFCRAASG